jgi:type IV secretion system protein VirB9
MGTRLLMVSSLVVVVLAGPVTRAADELSPGVRKVTASDRAVIPVQTRLRYSTLIVLPHGQEILDVICGDKDFWVVSATQNLAYVKPAKAGATTNLNLVTNTGAVYSFLLTEKSTGTPDLKVYVDDADETNAVAATPRFYSAAEVEALQREVTAAHAAVDAADRRATDAIAAYRQQYPSWLEFVYGQPKYQKPFLVRAIWNDGRFTYIQSDARELPAVYELKDGQPSLVTFQVEHGTYVIPKVIEHGYLALGKVHWVFAEQDR